MIVDVSRAERRMNCKANSVKNERAQFTFVYKGAYQNAQQIISILQVICNQRDAQKPTSVPTPSGQEISVADEIRKFKDLLDDGIITEEEFAAKKKQLLGL